MRKMIFFVFILFSLFFVPVTFAQNNSFVSIVNPIRGNDFWDLKDQTIETAVFGQIAILQKYKLPATWLLRFDALDSNSITQKLKERATDEKGLFMEITPSLTTQAKVKYHKSESWHAAGSAFLTGYDIDEREKLINANFEKFKTVFGYYPTSVGAWWIDAYSLGYMKTKYDITSVLIVADQYTTDNYQIWGQYFSTPFYPSKKNVLHPAQTLENKLDIVMTQWAPRDPVNSYGNGVGESTYSVQANDYIDFHSLDIKYFTKLIDIYTTQKFNQFAHLVVGLENSYSWDKYADEYERQIAVLAQKRDSNQLDVITLSDFGDWYKLTFPKLSPTQIIISDDPLGSFRKVVWFMNPYYRVGWFVTSDGSSFRDMRQYIDGQEELCFKARCDSVNFATSATRVLDEVSFGHKWIIDEGKITDFKANKEEDKFVITYKNEVGNLRRLEFLPRDIGMDGKISSIDQTILDGTKKQNLQHRSIADKGGNMQWSLVSVLLKIGQFLTFMILAVLIPGVIMTNNFFTTKSPLFLRLFISTTVGFVILTLIFYIASLIKIKPLIFVYIAVSFILFIRLKLFNQLTNLPKIRGPVDLITTLIIFVGMVFQAIPTFRSGLNHTYGMGFWGPNTHDGVWHVALINQLIKSIPPENPVFSGLILKNYHFFYDILIAATNYLSALPVLDLLFRFYPIIFSLLLGVGFYYLAFGLFEKRIGIKKTKIAAIFSLYLIYFAGSFGWIVEYLREKHIGGESAFWVNQSVSFNLNPPFAISLIIIITIFNIIVMSGDKLKGRIILIILVGTLMSFKSYSGVLILAALIIVGILNIIRKKDFSYFLIAIISCIVSLGLFVSNFSVNSSLIIFAPFWFIHAMVDSPDRLGWVRLSLARYSSQAQEQWPKFILSETLSLIIFIFGNLGLRFLSIGSLIKIKEVLKDDRLLIIFLVTILSVCIPILFIQSGNPWNTIQFFYPALYISALFSGLVISVLLYKLNKVVSFVLMFLILVFAPINSLVTANGYLGETPHAFISSKEQEGLQYLSGQPDGIILTYPHEKELKHQLSEPWTLYAYGSIAYVAAFSKKSVYLEDEGQNQILLTDYKKRLISSKNFFKEPLLNGAQFLKENDIKYIYLPKIYKIFLDRSIGVQVLYENEEIIVYGVNE